MESTSGRAQSKHSSYVCACAYVRVCVPTDVASNAQTCRRWSAERTCRIIAASVTGGAGSVKTSLSGEAAAAAAAARVRSSVSESLSAPPISFSPVGSLQMVADFQMFSSRITQALSSGRN